MTRAKSYFHYDSSLRFFILALIIIAALFLALFVINKQVASQGKTSVPQVRSRSAPLKVVPTPWGNRGVVPTPWKGK